MWVQYLTLPRGGGFSIEQPDLGLNYRTEELDGASVIRVWGDIDLTNVPSLWDVLVGAIRPQRAVVIDFSGLRYIDSVGMHMLLRASQRAQRMQAALVFVAPSHIQHLMNSVGLDRLVQVLPDVDTALRTLKTTA